MGGYHGISTWGFMAGESHTIPKLWSNPHDPPYFEWLYPLGNLTYLLKMVMSLAQAWANWADWSTLSAMAQLLCHSAKVCFFLLREIYNGCSLWNGDGQGRFCLPWWCLLLWINHLPIHGLFNTANTMDAPLISFSGFCCPFCRRSPSSWVRGAQTACLSYLDSSYFGSDGTFFSFSFNSQPFLGALYRRSVCALLPKPNSRVGAASGSPGDRGNLRADDDSWLRRHLPPPWHETGHEPHSAAEGSPPQIKQLAFQFCRPLLFGSTLNFTLAECCPLPKRVQVSQDPLSFVREDFPSSIFELSWHALLTCSPEAL